MSLHSDRHFKLDCKQVSAVRYIGLVSPKPKLQLAWCLPITTNFSIIDTVLNDIF